MAKKRSSNTATRTPENPVVEKVKPSSTPKKPGGEIDEIFSGKKSKKSLQENAEDPKKFGKEIDDIFSGKKRKKHEPEKKAGDDVVTKSNKVQKKNSQARNKGPKDINRSVDKLSTTSRKKTGDGLVIYTEEELGIGKADAGGTRLCPFDCECCF